jgi:hypothetical protein
LEEGVSFTQELQVDSNMGKWHVFFDTTPHSNTLNRQLLPGAIKELLAAATENWTDPAEFSYCSARVVERTKAYHLCFRPDKRH